MSQEMTNTGEPSDSSTIAAAADQIKSVTFVFSLSKSRDSEVGNALRSLGSSPRYELSIHDTDTFIRVFKNLC